MTTAGHERELFRLRPSLIGSLLPLGPSFRALYNSEVEFALVPWRGVAIGIAALIVGALLLPRLISNTAILFVLWAALLTVPIVLEVLHRKDVITESAFVRRRGILGRVQRCIPLAEIARVEYSFPPGGRRWNVGDVIIFREVGGRTLLRGVKGPAAVAQLILDAKARRLGVHHESLDV